MSRLGRLRRRLADERGLTLIELLVAMATGLVVAGAAMGLLTVSEHLSSRATDQIDADQRGRVAMNTIVQQLHSSCVASKVTPVQTNSDATHLYFLSQYGSAIALTPNLEQITYTAGSPPANGTLKESTTAPTSGSAPSWIFPAPNAATPLLTNVTQAVVNGAAQPVFQYFAYSNGQLSTTPLPVPLSLANAQSVADVQISFAAGPSTPGGTQADRTINQYSQVALRLSPASGSAATNAPCA